MSRLPETITIPGAIDLHVHFREPGTNKSETIASGTKAALQGGFVLVCDMPNNPGYPTWSLKGLQDKHRRIRKTAHIPVATYTGSQPQENNLAELPAMSKLSIGLKLYGAPTTGNIYDYQAGDFSEIVRIWHRAAPKKPIMLHSGKDNLADFIKLIARDAKHHLHVCHINSVKDVKLVKSAKNRGLKVTCGICPHHILKTSYSERSEGWFAKMLPALVHQDEADELFRLFVKGDVDVLETDHAPHSVDAKWAAEGGEGLCYGVPGIEFALPLLFYQMTQGRISLNRIIQATSAKPASIIEIKLAKSSKVVWEMSKYRITERMAVSKSAWTPYVGMLAVGKVKEIKFKGKPEAIYRRGTVV